MYVCVFVFTEPLWDSYETHGSYDFNYVSSVVVMHDYNTYATKSIHKKCEWMLFCWRLINKDEDELTNTSLNNIRTVNNYASKYVC